MDKLKKQKNCRKYCKNFAKLREILYANENAVI